MSHTSRPVFLRCIPSFLCTPVVTLASLTLVTLTLACSSAIEAKPTGKLAPTKDQQKASREVASLVSQVHYNNRPMDDRLSEQMFDRYLEVLDPNRSYFFASDLEEFSPLRKRLDDALENGDLGPAFAIYNRYQERIEDRLQKVLNSLDKQIDSLDFSKKETYNVERKEAAWAKDEAEMKELWRKRIKHLVLQDKLQGKKLTDIKETLHKRFKNILNRATQTNKEDAFQTYMNAFTHVFDPHTTYFTPRESENFDINMSLQLQGIGAVLQSEDEYTKVVRLVPGGPADKAKQLKPADKIVGVGQQGKEMQDVVGWRLDEVVDLIRGKKGTTVNLEIMPADTKGSANRTISIVRDTVKLEDRAAQATTIKVKGPQGPQTFGVINLPAFYHDFQAMQNGDPNYRSSTRDMTRLVKELKQQNISGLIIDLRNNGGGSLQEAQKTVGLFIPTGPVVQVKSYKGIESLGDVDPRVLYDGPLAVIVNRLSASASEIFAGAIQDYNRGIVIGEQTFGKGTVQSLQGLDHGKLKVTLAKFYRISGESNQHQGIAPDISFPSLFDFSEIGESALPNALPADSIRPARYRHWSSANKNLAPLLTEHQKRAKTNPDFIYVNEKIEQRERFDKKTVVSLNEKERKQEIDEAERQSLASENRKRKAKGEKVFATMEDLRNYAEEEVTKNLSSNDYEIDYVVEEAAEILEDAIELSAPSKTQVAAE